MYVTHLECPQCANRYEGGRRIQVCDCGAPLLVRYDLERVDAVLDKDVLRGRAASLWRYRELLPVKESANIVSLGEGMTPLVRAPNLGRRFGFENLFIKDEGIIPTGTFKARGAAVGVSCAREVGVDTLAMPTNGNAGGAWAATFTAARQLLETGWIKPEEEVVLLNTGTGLKYPQTVQFDPPLLRPGDDLPMDG